MLLRYAEANAFNTSGAHNGGLLNGAGGLRLLTPFGEFIMCTASTHNIFLCMFLNHRPPILLKALTIHISSMANVLEAVL